MPCRGAAPAAPAALSVAIRMRVRVRPRHWKAGRPRERRGSAELEIRTAPSRTPRSSPGQPCSPLPPAPVWKHGAGCLDPAQSRSIELGTTRRHAKGKRRAA